jgi:hypothetical protein
MQQIWTLYMWTIREIQACGQQKFHITHSLCIFFRRNRQHIKCEISYKESRSSVLVCSYFCRL